MIPSPVLSSAISWRFLGNALQPVLQVAAKICSPIKIRPKPVVMAKKHSTVAPTPLSQLDIALEELYSHKDTWQMTTCTERGILLQRCLDKLQEVAKKASEAATSAHGTYGSGIGEEYLFWVPIAMGLAEYKEAMEAQGNPPPVRIFKRNGRWIADVFPKGMSGVVFGGIEIDVWIQPGKEPSQGNIYRVKNEADFEPNGHVSLVLGAGNQISVVVLDILHKLLVEDKVVIVKMNPVNAFLGVYVKELLQPFYEGGYLRIVHGTAKEGAYLCEHRLVNDIHLTGSSHTFNSIVFGTPTVQEGMTPVSQKRVTGELGCFTPMVIVPGDWTEMEMEYVASTVVAGLTSNSGHNCCALECIVTLESWPLREKFTAVLTKKLNSKERQVAWYPGSQTNYEKFLREFPNAQKLGHSTHSEEATLPWLFATNLLPEQARPQSETWCGVLQEVVLPGEADAVDGFMQRAREFCNERCWGTLSCSVIIDPPTQEKYHEAYSSLIADLRYGSITINAPAMLGFLPAASWGAFPGNPVSEIGSGNCFVHNTCLFDYPEKSVSYYPWQLHPIPFWADVTNKDAIIDAVMAMIKSPGLVNMCRVVIPALRASNG